MDKRAQVVSEPLRFVADRLWFVSKLFSAVCFADRLCFAPRFALKLFFLNTRRWLFGLFVVAC